MSADYTPYKKSRIKRTAVIICTVLFALAALCSFLFIADAVTCANIRTVPSYAMDQAALGNVLSKPLEEWTESDYSLVYSQTGLTKAYFDGEGCIDEDFVKSCQADLFYEAQPEHDSQLFPISHDYFPDKLFSIVPLRAGDVIVSSSVHMFGWPMGHTALVISPTLTIQAMSVGTLSMTWSVSWFKHAANFIVLRPRLSAEQAKEVADWAYDNLLGLEYSFMTGISTAKDQTEDPQTTQCAHLAWQAYKAFGYDADSNGGPIVTPRNLAESDFFEVVQVNGFDLEKLW